MPSTPNTPSAPTISVVLPTYERRELVLRAVESVLSQTRPADEVIVVDDASTDGTAETLATYPVRVLRQPERLGVSAARNRGVAAAVGEWVAFLDSDDEWRPEKLEEQLAALARVGADENRVDGAEGPFEVSYPLVHCDEIWIRGGRRVNPRQRHGKQGGWIYRHCLPLCAISPSAAMIHRQTLLDLGGFDDSLPACEDYDLWLRLCSQAPVLYVDHPLVIKYGGHADQLSRQPALDRYRIRALAKILDSGRLRGEDLLATRATLHGKIAVYAAGARKRGRHQEADALEALARRWSDDEILPRDDLGTQP